MSLMVLFLLVFFRVIVGAPEAQTSQPNVYRGGGVFRCDIAVDDNCIPVEFDRQGNWTINYIIRVMNLLASMAFLVEF